MKVERPLRALGVVVALAAPMWLWAPSWFFRDAARTTTPTAYEAADAAVSRALRTEGPRGALIEWVSRPGFGESFVATRRVGAFNPLDPARALLPPARSGPWRAAFWLLVAGWTAYRLFRLLGLLRTPALFGALSWSMHGAFATSLAEPWLRVAALAPAAIWMVERLLRRPEAARAAAVAIVVAAIGLADHPETGIVVVGAAIAWAVVRSITARSALGGSRRSLRATGWLIPAIALGAAVAWPQLAPQLTSPLTPTGAPLASADWLASIAPIAYGREGFGYVGIVTLFGAAVAVVTSAWTDRRVRAFGLLLIASATLATTTGWTEGATAVTSLALSALAALGVQRCWPLFGPPAVTDGRLRTAAAVVALPLGVVAAHWIAGHIDTPIAVLWQDDRLAPLVAYVGLGLVMLATILTACRRARAPWSGLAWRVAPIALVALELGVHGAVDHAARPAVAVPPSSPRALLVDSESHAVACDTHMPTPGTIEVRLPARSRAGVIVLAATADDGWRVDSNGILAARRDATPTFLRANVSAGPAAVVTVRHRASGLGSRLAIAAIALSITLVFSLVGLRGRRGGATLPEPRPYLWLAAPAAGPDSDAD